MAKEESYPVVHGKVTLSNGTTIQGRDVNGDGVADAVVFDGKTNGRTDLVGAFSNNGYAEIQFFKTQDQNRATGIDRDSSTSLLVVEAWNKAVKDGVLTVSELSTLSEKAALVTTEVMTEGKMSNVPFKSSPPTRGGTPG